MADSEWASDVLFASRASLEAVYAPLVRHAVLTFGTAQVLRCFGQPVPCSGQVPHRYRHEVSTNVKERVEGVRIKHWFNHNNLKRYDKGSVLRAECTLREPEQFRVERTTAAHPERPPTRRPVRKGIVDLPHRAALGQAANERYLEALAAVHLTTPLRTLAEPLCRPVPAPTGSRTAAAVAAPPSPSRGRGSAGAGAAGGAPASDPGVAPPRRVRALNPLAAADAALLTAVSRHEFLIGGLRNRDVRRLLFGDDPPRASERRQQAAAVTRQLRLLQAHGLLQRIPKTHRYVIPEAARHTLTALQAARNASTEQLLRNAS